MNPRNASRAGAWTGRGVRLPAPSALLLALAAALPLSATTEEPRDFTTDVLPLLSDRCFRCHGPDAGARKAGLRLDDRDVATRPRSSGRVAIVPGDAEASELVRRITSEDPGEVMPPPESNLVLSSDEKQLLVEWIAAGAPYARHWSFRPLRRPALPEVARPGWAQNPIDRFVLRRLEEEGLEPSREADPRRLARRVSLDLLGLPPTPAEADALAADPSPDAYERYVDRLLASPAFGERVAWDWLDLARYADSNGYQGDRERTMWPWRDWVVSAFNRNLPYDTFTEWQLAGDLLPDAGFEERLATGFSRNHMINGEGGRIAEENRVEYVMDMTETMGTVWLGLTLNCCRCHDHKFDPISRRDYYELFAFFNQTPVDGSGGDPQTPPAIEVPDRETRTALREIASRLESLRSQVAEREAAGGASAEAEGREGARTPDDLRAILEKPVGERTTEELEKLEKHWKERSPSYASALAALRETLRRREAVRRSIPRVMVMEDRPGGRATRMLEKGLYNKPGEEVTAAVLTDLAPAPPSMGRDRLALARWLLSSENPLTARVTVNRFWQSFFGRGLVETVEDFGRQGKKPSHPALLDWLACELRDSGWDTKRLFRLIVTSATYRQTSRVGPELRERDPENVLLARGARFRLPSWALRDQALAVSGLLVRTIGGEPVFPYQPEGVWEDATFGKKTYQEDHGAKLYRRSLYTFWRRIVGPTLFFDSASRQTCTVRETRTNSPLHALTTLNDVTYVEAARALAANILRKDPDAEPRRTIARLFRCVLARPPAAGELDVLEASHELYRRHFAESPDAARELLSVGESAAPPDADPVRLAALTAVAATVLNLDETLTKE